MKASMRAIEVAVCGRFGLTTDAIRGLDLTRKVARPRQIAMFLAREMTDRSFPSIGGHFKRDHSTVMHAVEAIKTMVTIDPKVAAHVEECRAATLEVDRARQLSMRAWGDRLMAGEVMLQPAQEMPAAD